jgi:hypothetical protein
MTDKFEWKAEIKFNGTAAEFNRFTESMAAALKAGTITIGIPEWKCRPPHHLAGCMPIPIDVLLGEERIKEITRDMLQVQINWLRDIRGGMRTPHLHLGDNVVLLDRARFKTVVTQVAQELAARRVEATEDYIGVMSAINAIGDDPYPVP